MTDAWPLPALPYGCDWDGECMSVFATRNELDAHEQEYWDDLLDTDAGEPTTD